MTIRAVALTYKSHKKLFATEDWSPTAANSYRFEYPSAFFDRKNSAENANKMTGLFNILSHKDLTFCF